MTATKPCVTDGGLCIVSAHYVHQTPKPDTYDIAAPNPRVKIVLDPQFTATAAQLAEGDAERPRGIAGTARSKR